MELPSKPLARARCASRCGGGVNFPDTLIIQDKPVQAAAPVRAGHEIPATSRSGRGCRGYKVGDRVIGMVGHGGYATEPSSISAPAAKPKNMSYDEVPPSP